MCGICGIVYFNSRCVDSRELRVMMNRMKHRGPDDQGMFLDGATGLGFVRLSILDLSPAGHQPMVSEDQRYVLIFNGEIFNYIELREELKEKYSFRSQTDTEVLLNAYREWGTDCMHRFNGMFAFAIYDKKTGTLFAARDRYGIKPFYYHLDAECFIFASEERAILPFLKCQTPNPRAIYEYLVYNRTDQGDYTFFRDIRKLPHGARAQVKNGRLTIDQWYVLQEQLKSPFQNAEEFGDAFKESVKLRLRSDVPLGVCLSGGLDSSSIVSVLVKAFNIEDVRTFSAVYEPGDPADERGFIDEYRSELTNMHFTYPSGHTLIDDLPRFIDCHSEPVASLGPYAQFKVMELASEHVTVTLDGQGADEQLAGYHYFFASYFKELIKGLRLLTLVRELAAYGKNHHSAALAVKYLAFYLSPSSLKKKLRITNVIDRHFYDQFKLFSNLPADLYNPRNLNESLIQHFEYKLEHLLKWEDHNSAWFSLEARVPFLDHHLVERTLSLPPEQIIHRGETKHILRQAMLGMLPEKIRMRQDKIGFDTPWEKWFKSPLFRELIFDLLHSARFRQRGILNSRKCIRDFELFLMGKTDIPKEIWKWINLELWFRRFIDNNR
ncbi:MAG: asparagine synthase (glutamine-hydrolyzing) [Candidatus Omnitrophota bacterium]